MRIKKVKLILFTFITILLSSCSISKNLIGNEKLIKNNKLFVNDQLVAKDTLSGLFIQKKNSTFIGIPIGALIYSSSKKNTDSIFNNWINKKNKRKRLTKIFSEKQVDQLKDYHKNFNEWKKNNGEKIEIIDSSKTLATTKNLNSYFQNIGFLENKVVSEIIVDENNTNYADVNYKVTTGPQYYVGEIDTMIESTVLDSLYKINFDKSFLKKNDLFKTKNFELERERLNKLFKNSGVYNFQINSILYDVEIDSSSNIYSLPVKIIITGKNYTIHKIDKISITNIKKDGNFDFNKDFLNTQIKFKVGEKFNDSLRTLTLQNFNKLDLFSFPSVSYSFIKNKKNKLEANIILNSKKKHAIGFGFDIKQSNIEDIGSAPDADAWQYLLVDAEHVSAWKAVGHPSVRQVSHIGGLRGGILH